MFKKLIFSLIFMMFLTGSVFAACRISRSDYTSPHGMKIGRDDWEAGLKSMPRKIERNLPEPGIHTVQTGIDYG
jgi:hypothetical protein